MPFVSIVTLVAVALIVIPLTVALLRIILMLHEVSFNLGTIVALIRSIDRQTDTVTPTIATANKRLTPVEQAAANVAARHGTGNGHVVELTGR